MINHDILILNTQKNYLFVDQNIINNIPILINMEDNINKDDLIQRLIFGEIFYTKKKDKKYIYPWNNFNFKLIKLKNI